MAKRKRLTPARSDYLETPSRAGLETKSMPFAAPPAPIAAVASDASASAALSELTESMAQARAEGRMVVALPLTAIEEHYLVRDRLSADPEEMSALVESIRARGQQTPIEVTELEAGRYGLISGWRRLRALSALQEETGRFDTVLAFLRRPEDASDAYLAMVEENEIRVGLSYYERARIADKAVAQGVFEDHKKALLSLFRSASRAKRSKIRGYLPVVSALDGVLRFPQALGERIGVRLGKALEADPSLAARLQKALTEGAPGDAEQEQSLILAALAPPRAEAVPEPKIAAGQVCTLTKDVRMRVGPDGGVTLYGPGVNDHFRTKLLKAFGSSGA
ncbi:ParB N-terminal domain-containing protein [Pelagovum pacificum]|uniref:Nuclease n=1 Tax=Pelagovum pacificum TaxID=2588711 RepID=A0A5C5G958_9RHOB|nr:ParB N-terminal domain-containing protein [Pelagovum pacificum]QQA45076.1 ParB N-terminal domain-containing protein [Pelagovum pacificum]TNY30550.1 nuclease [Pelagovum pacificum]